MKKEDKKNQVEEEKDEDSEEKIKISKEDLEELLREDNKEINASAIRHFLANQEKDVSLRQVAIDEESSLENLLPEKQEKRSFEEDRIEYIKYEGKENSKYQEYGPEINTKEFKEDRSTASERILDQQKKFSKSAFGGMHQDLMKSKERDEYLMMEDIDPKKRMKYEMK